MKTIASLLLPVTALASVLPRDPQLTGLRANNALKQVSSDPKEPQIRPDAKRVMLKYGPIKMAGTKETKPFSLMPSMDPAGQSYMLNLAGPLCPGGCTVLSGQVAIYNADGSKADPSNGLYTHHILTRDMTQSENSFVSLCSSETAKPKPASSRPIKGFGRGFIGVGDDNRNGFQRFTTKDGKFASGYHVGADDKFSVIADLVNYDPKPREVFLSLDIEYLPGQVGDDADITLLSVGGCRPTLPKVDPAGPVNTTSQKFTFYEDGNILWAQGHLHDGGEQMLLLVNDKPACVSKAEYGKGAAADVNGKAWQTIEQLSDCNGPIAIKKGDTLSMVATYDLKTHPIRPMAEGEEGHGMDLMAMWTMTFASPGNKSGSEAPATGDPDAAPETPAVPAAGASSDAGAGASDAGMDAGDDAGAGAEIAASAAADAGSITAKASCKRKRRALEPKA
ncbi:hypothetical protein LTS18_005003 [Coniosporium uncinatum]|uniref:Uncharacterized protein n=1 Tax=Coniosporium uncinatum TaxID=93489 RepID=A0ACC3DRY2_9PEZI|nr:hypothetical protein LTS18_005003 [Coniosporium uncinatum]